MVVQRTCIIYSQENSRGQGRTAIPEDPCKESMVGPAKLCHERRTGRTGTPQYLPRSQTGQSPQETALALTKVYIEESE